MRRRRTAPPLGSQFAANWHIVECWVAVVAFSFIAAILLLDVLGRELLGPLVRLFGLKPARPESSRRRRCRSTRW